MKTFFCYKKLLFQGHSHGVYPLIYLPGGMDESDTESDIEEDEDIENPDPKEEESDVDLLIAPNDLVITGSADATAKVWSVYSGECIHVSIKSQIWYLLFSKKYSKNLSKK